MSDRLAATGERRWSRPAGMTLLALVIGTCLVPDICVAAYQAQCRNPGLCEETICVSSRDAAGKACQVECGNQARPTSVKKSACTPAD